MWTEFFDWVGHGLVQTTALGGERTGEDDDVKSFFVLTSGIPNQTSVRVARQREIRVVELSGS